MDAREQAREMWELLLEVDDEETREALRNQWLEIVLLPEVRP